MMNLIILFETQKKLDERIVKEKGLEGRDLLPEKILALLTELGELSNEWRGFKFWSENREPRTKVPITAWGEPYRNPMLEEYVDCLHFILSIGNDVLVEPRKPIKLLSFFSNVTGQFNSMFHLISGWDEAKLLINEELFHVGLNNFLHLGELLGFTWEEIETAYYEKNKINHSRQKNGY